MEGILLPLVEGVAAVVLIVVGVICVFLVRRLVIARGVGTFDCSLRGDASHRAGGWMLGIARYEADRLDWFRVFTVNPRPERSLSRARLVILETFAPEAQESSSFLPGWVIVRCAYGALTLELAMSDPAYNGLAAWLESAPPGQHVHVA